MVESRRTAGTLPPAAVAASLVAVALVASLVKARSNDLWWHLAAGREILRTFSIPRADPFSFASSGVPWIDHEWLFQVGLHLLHALLGPLAFTLINAASALAVAAIGYRTMRISGGSPGLALAVVSAGLAGLRFRLAERPDTLSLPLATAAAALLLGLVARQGGVARLPACLGILAALWANLHAGALLAPALAAAGTAGAALDMARLPRGQRIGGRAAVLRAGSATVLISVCLLINPYAHRLYLVPFGVSEALAPENLLNPEWVAPSMADFPYFYLALAASGVAAGAAIAGRRPLAFARAALLALAASMALASVRHIGVFFALLPVAIDPSALPPRLERLVARGGVFCWLLAVAWMAVTPPPGAALGIGVQERRFPEKAADFVDARMKEARLYNDVAFGGYLIWRGHPERRVFIDGRNEVHGDLLRDLSESIDDGRRWSALMDRHGVEGAVLSYRAEPIEVRDAVTGEASRSTFSRLHFPPRAWALVHWDDVAMVFVRREGRYGGLAGELEYHRVQPEGWLAGTWRPDAASEGPVIARELRRKLAEDPGCRLAGAMTKVYDVGEARTKR